jgi:glutamine cyclotransferase
MKYFFFVFVLFSIVACNNNESAETDGDLIPQKTGIAAPTAISYNLVAQHPHDTGSYTQGLQLYQGKMYEASGDYENSSLRVTDFKTGKVEKKHMMGSASVFGEGITILNEKIYQLTWQSNVAYVYNINDITKPIQTFKWPYEGWGITNNGTDLIISDGSANLYFVNPQDFKVKSTIAVQTNLGPVDNLNELEWIDGSVYANIYTTDKIVKIDPESGHVTGIMELKNLLQPNEVVEGRTDVLNGIAYDSATKTMYVTGKRWPKLFEVKLN